MHFIPHTQFFNDASEQQSGLDGWQANYTQLSRGAYSGSTSRLDLGGIALIEERFNAVVEQETCPPKNKLLLLFSERQERRINGNLFQSQSFWHVGGEDIRLVSAANNRTLSILIDQSAVPEWDASRQPPVSAILHSGMAGDAALDWIASVLVNAPDIVTRNPEEISAFFAMVRDKVSDILSAVLLAGVGVSAAPTSASRLVARARAMADEMSLEPLTVSRLTRDLGVSDHVLRAAFLQCTGVSSHAWLRYRRLARARRQLLKDGNERAVAETAMENGFFHLGRFAGFYAEVYGEAPGETLRRRAA